MPELLCPVTSVKDGAVVGLPSLWQNRRVVLCMLRHIGCPCCVQQAAAAANMHKALAAHKVALVAVSMGSRSKGEEFVRRTGFPGELYMDTSAHEAGSPPPAYALLRLAHGAHVLQDARAEGAVSRAQGAEMECDDAQVADALQAGGVFVLGAGNTCDYAFRCKYAGHMPDWNEVLQLGTGVTVTGEPAAFPGALRWSQELCMDQPAAALAPASALATAKRVLQRPAVAALLTVALVAVMALAGVMSLAPSDSPMKAALAPALGVLQLPQEWVIALFAVAGFASMLAFAEAHTHRMRRGRAERVSIALVRSNVLLKPTDWLTPSKLDALALGRGALHVDCPDAAAPGAGHPAVTTAADASERACQEMLCYVREFLAKPHPRIGRPGAVCPFIPAALKHDTLFMHVLRTGEQAQPHHLVQLVYEYVTQFSSSTPVGSRAAAHKALVLLFPDLPASRAEAVVGALQRLLLPLCIESGLMISEFHQHHSAPALHQSDFFPSRAPHSCLLVRRFVPDDGALLDDAAPGSATREHFLRSFVHPADVKRAKDALARREARAGMAR